MQIKHQLFCFSFAGGNSSFFDVIINDLPEIDVVPFEYSGHGSRHKEPLYDNFGELAEDMFRLFKKNYHGGEYSLFGYSMGTISLVEVLKRITESNEVPLPNQIFLAAHEPMTKAEFAECTAEETDAWVKKRTIKFGTVPEKLIHNKSFWRMYLPLYRADYSIIGKYRFEDLNLTSDIPATVFYSETDTPIKDMILWRNIFVGECDFHLYEGNHFFIQEHHKDMADIIRKKMCGRKQ